MSSTVQDVLYAVFKGRYSIEDLRESWQVREIRGKLLHWGAVDDGKWTVEAVDKETGDIMFTTKEVSSTAMSRKVQSRFAMGAEEWVESHLHSEDITVFQIPPLGFGSSMMESHATSLQTEVVEKVDENTIVVYTTGAKIPNGTVKWDSIRMIHCDVVFKGIGALCSFPISHPRFPERKGVFRDMSIRTLVLKDQDAEGSSCIAELATMQSIPRHTKVYPQHVLKSWALSRRKKAMADLSRRARTNLMHRHQIMTSLQSQSVNGSPISTDGVLSPEKEAQLLSVFKAEQEVLERVFNDSYGWRPASETVGLALFDSAKVRSIGADIISKASNKAKTVKSDIHALDLSPPQIPIQAGLAGISFSASGASFSSQPPARGASGSTGKSGVVAISTVANSTILVRSIAGSGLQVDQKNRMLKCKFSVLDMKPKTLANAIKTTAFWSGFSCSSSRATPTASVQNFDKLRNSQQIWVSIGDSAASNWVGLQQIKDLGRETYQACHIANTSTICSLLTGVHQSSLLPFYSMMTFAPHQGASGEDTRITIAQSVGAKASIESEAKLLVACFSNGLSAAIADMAKNSSRHDGPECVAALPEPLKSLLSVVLWPILGCGTHSQ
mmetsp:Transcript_37432/g.105669  ORF Transcript_37432/g.105669 Transcript_37432/m.105669 type:complete len:613 (-) Transcript_37432:216-2054(-)